MQRMGRPSHMHEAETAWGARSLFSNPRFMHAEAIRLWLWLYGRGSALLSPWTSACVCCSARVCLGEKGKHFFSPKPVVSVRNRKIGLYDRGITSDTLGVHATLMLCSTSQGAAAMSREENWQGR